MIDKYTTRVLVFERKRHTSDFSIFPDDLYVMLIGVTDVQVHLLSYRAEMGEHSVLHI